MRRLLPGLLIVGAIAAMPSSASADVFGPISLASASTTEQADYAHDPAMSADGRYVAYDGYFDGQTGVWRRDLQTGTVAPVAVGEPGTPAGSALLPSISEEGRYVSFTTQAALTPANDLNHGPDVYVRDMDVSETQPCAEEQVLQPAEACAFTLASAVSGSTQGLTYEYSAGEGRENEEKVDGAQASSRNAITAGGREVIFVTTARSDLDGAGTPALEAAVRHLDSGITETVSVEIDPETGAPKQGENGKDLPVAAEFENAKTYGAVYDSSSKPPPFEAQGPYEATYEVPASISADGSTVAWLAQDIAEQAPVAAGEFAPARYSDVLWRRISGGEGARARRVSGGEQGPFLPVEGDGIWRSEKAESVPRLDRDGHEVAFSANAPLAARGEDFGLGSTQLPSDLYIAEMQEGALPAITPLTEFAGGDTTSIAEDASIFDYSISPSGSQVAFSTKRIAFPLGSPALVSEPATVPGLLELFDIDLSNATLTRVSEGYEGGAPEHPHSASTSKEEDAYPTPGDGALAPSFSGDGEELAFSSTASNLVYGDGNTPPHDNPRFDGSDVFLVKRIQFLPTPAAQIISEAPAGPAVIPTRTLGVTASSLGDGRVRLYVEAPGAGTLRAAASAGVTIASKRTSRTRGKKSARAKVLTRTVATLVRPASGNAEGLTILTLGLASSYRALAEHPRGLSGTVTVTFTAAGQRALHARIAVKFRRKPAHKAKKASSQGQLKR